MAELTLTEDGQRALREAEGFGWRANVAILAAEHLLGGALVVLHEAGHRGLPGRAAIESAIGSIHGTGSEPLESNVMWGSAARDALEAAAAGLQRAGGTRLSAAVIARGVIDSGEVTPMFYAALGTTKAALREALPS